MGLCTLRDTRGGNISKMDYHPIPGERGGGGGWSSGAILFLAATCNRNWVSVSHLAT